MIQKEKYNKIFIRFLIHPRSL